MSTTHKIVIKVNNDYEKQIREGIDAYVEKYGILPFKLRCGTLAKRMIMSNEPLKEYLKKLEIGISLKKSVPINLIEIDSKNGISFEEFSTGRLNFSTSYNSNWEPLFTSSSTTNGDIW